MANWASFVATVKSLPVVKQRAVSAVIGAVVADAAAYPFHWVYDQDKIVKCLEGGKNPEFFQPTQNPFFILPVGSQTSYGDFAIACLRGLVKENGFNPDAIKEELYKAVGPGSAYATADTTQKPIVGPYSTHSIKNFLKNYEAGVETGKNGNSDGECLVMTVPVLSLLYDTKDVMKVCEDSVKVVTDNAMGINSSQAACVILQTLILQGAVPEDTVEVIKSTADKFPAAIGAALRAVVDMTGSVSEASKKFGLACAMPQTLQSALYPAKGKDNSYVKAVRSTIVAGGNSAFRAAFVGACMAAKYGIDGIPEDWVERVLGKQELLDMSLKLAEMMK